VDLSVVAVLPEDIPEEQQLLPKAALFIMDYGAISQKIAILYRFSICTLGKSSSPLPML
jgi:hypothetical protein